MILPEYINASLQLSKLFSSELNHYDGDQHGLFLALATSKCEL